MSEQDAPDDAEEREDADPDAERDGDAGDEAVEDEGAPDPELLERVEEDDPDRLARELAHLRERVADLEADLADVREERDDLESKLKRKQADFQNYKKRQERRREQERQRATEDLVERLLDVRDNLVRALETEGDVRDGVETTLGQFDDVLAEENVAVIDPEPGTEVDPQRHEVLMRVEGDHEAGTVADLHRPGYEMAGTVLRPAQVTVVEDE